MADRPLSPVRRSRVRGLLVDALALIGAFAGATALAALLGAANLGTALSFGQLAFAPALLWVLLRDRGERRGSGPPQPQAARSTTLGSG